MVALIEAKPENKVMFMAMITPGGPAPADAGPRRDTYILRWWCPDLRVWRVTDAESLEKLNRFYRDEIRSPGSQLIHIPAGVA
jgi:hypothetical protein